MYRYVELVPKESANGFNRCHHFSRHWDNCFYCLLSRFEGKFKRTLTEFKREIAAWQRTIPSLEPAILWSAPSLRPLVRQVTIFFLSFLKVLVFSFSLLCVASQSYLRKNRVWPEFVILVLIKRIAGFGVRSWKST